MKGMDFSLNNITLLAAVLMGGAYNLWGAVVAAVFVKVLPALLQDWNAPADILLILFGVGVIQTLLTAPQGLGAPFRRTALDRVLQVNDQGCARRHRSIPPPRPHAGSCRRENRVQS